MVPTLCFTSVTEKTRRVFWKLSIVIMLLITVADVLLGSRVILIGLLIVGPCCASFSVPPGSRPRKQGASQLGWPFR